MSTDYKDWRYQPLTWPLMRTQFTGWFARNRVPLAIAIVVAAAIWGALATHLRFTQVPPPVGATYLHVTNYVQAYDVYSRGAAFILIRNRDQLFPFAYLGFITAWWVSFIVIRQRAQEDNLGHEHAFPIGAILALLLCCLLGSLFVSSSVDDLTQLQIITIDPASDTVSMNGSAIGKVSDIQRFDAVEEHLYRSRRTSFGIIWKGGRYEAFDEGESGGANVLYISAYLNEILRARHLIPN